MTKPWISLAALIGLAACAEQPASVAPPSRSDIAPAAFETGALPPPAQCALFAREFTGINIRANAFQWWDLAAGQYPRGDAPRPDAILVLRSTPQLPLGHVAIVKTLANPREITVTHANWGMDDPTRRIIHDSTPVVDASPRNDWTQVRFWNVKAHAFGKVYAAYGFIYPRGYTHDSQPIW